MTETTTLKDKIAEFTANMAKSAPKEVIATLGEPSAIIGALPPHK